MPDDDVANIHLEVQGEQHCVTVPICSGRQPVTALLPAARAIAGKIIELSVLAVEQEGRTVSCCAGCGACCRQLVVVSLAEAQALAELVDQMPPDRQAAVRARFSDALKRLETAGLLETNGGGDRHLIQPLDPTARPLAWRYFQQQIACPFLEDESCSIHPERPLVCREYLVTSPAERCARLYEEPIDTVHAPVHMGEVMVQTTHRVANVPIESIPLVLALEWSGNHPGALDRADDGLAMLRTLLDRTQAACNG